MSFSPSFPRREPRELTPSSSLQCSHEHQVRTPKCPFFIATVYVPPKAGASFKVVQEEAAEDNDEEFEMIDAPTSKVMKTPTVKGKKAAEVSSNSLLGSRGDAEN